MNVVVLSPTTSVVGEESVTVSPAKTMVCGAGTTVSMTGVPEIKETELMVKVWPAMIVVMGSPIAATFVDARSGISVVGFGSVVELSKSS